MEPALGAALYFDAELAREPAPFATLVEALAGTRSRDGAINHFTVPIGQRSAAPIGKPLNLTTLIHRITDGTAFSAGVETAAKTAADARLWIHAQTGPAGAAKRYSKTACRYDLDAHFGPARLRELDARRVLDALYAFADAAGARAGTLHWATATAFAAGLATLTYDGLSEAQEQRVADLVDDPSRWGDAIRGPAWGTVLSPAHVATLGGQAKLEREAPCARVVPLPSGGAVLEATLLDALIVEGRDDVDGELVELAAYLTQLV